MTNDGKRVVILDTSALVSGLDPFQISEEQYTVPAVAEEISASSMAAFRFKTAWDCQRVKVRVPRDSHVGTVRTAARLLGDETFLSEADIQVLALALELKALDLEPTIATDDYSMQNVADYLEIEFISLATLGIRFRLRWTIYCPACYRRYPANLKNTRCRICGTILKRKPVRKKDIRPRKSWTNRR